MSVIIPLNEEGFPLKVRATFPMWLVAGHVALVTMAVALMVLS